MNRSCALLVAFACVVGVHAVGVQANVRHPYYHGRFLDNRPPGPASAPASMAVSGDSLTSAKEKCPITKIDLEPGYACETPYSPSVRLHVLITLKDRESYRALRHLGALGLSNADIYVYLRNDPHDDFAANVDLPCGMKLHERLLLPNLGDEGAVFLVHVASVYDDMPDAIINLHGGPLPAHHAYCSVAIRRMRAFYRGLGDGPQATPVMKAFASDYVTLNSVKLRGGFWSVNDCCGFLLAKAQDFPFADYPQCPWERVGDAKVLYAGRYPQALCQLRDRTPDSNWTVLSSDLPEFFIRKAEILAQYENDPLQRVPITHRPRATPDSGATGAASFLRKQLSTAQAAGDGLKTGSKPVSRFAAKLDGVFKQMVPFEAQGGVVSRSARLLNLPGRRALLSRDAAMAPGPPGGLSTAGQERLTNVRERVFPGGKTRPNHDKHAWLHDRVAGLDTMWEWILKANGMFENFARPPRAGEREARFCCMQFAVPGHVLKYAPKAWWEDVSLLATHEKWQPRGTSKEDGSWGFAIGILVEYSLWPSLNRKYATEQSLRAYLDVDREMGEDPKLSQCELTLKKPLRE